MLPPGRAHGTSTTNIAPLHPYCTLWHPMAPLIDHELVRERECPPPLSQLSQRASPRVWPFRVNLTLVLAASSESPKLQTAPVRPQNQMSAIKYRISNIRCQTSNIKCPCQVSHISKSDIRNPSSDRQLTLRPCEGGVV